MSLNAWIGLLIVVIPNLVLVTIAGAVRICRLVIGDEPSGHPARGGTGNRAGIDEEHLPPTPSP